MPIKKNYIYEISRLHRIFSSSLIVSFSLFPSSLMLGYNTSVMEERELDKSSGELNISSTQNDEYYNILNKRHKKPDNLTKWEAQLQKIKDLHKLEKIKYDIAQYPILTRCDFGKYLAVGTDDVMTDFKLFLDQLLPTSNTHCH